MTNAADVTTVDVEGSSVNTINNTAGSEGSAPKILDLLYALPDQYAERAAWLMRRDIEKSVRKLVDAQGRRHFPVERDNGERLLAGTPVFNVNAVPDDGTDGNTVMIIGDVSEYVIASRAQLSITVLPERYADSDQTGLVLSDRVGGTLANADAVRFGTV